MPSDRNFAADAASLGPKTDFSRRAMMVTTLATGFAAAVQPVAAQTTITTDGTGIEAGEIKIKTASGDIPAYRAMPKTGSNLPTDPRRAGDLRRARAHQGRLPPPRQARLLRHRAGAVRPPGRRFEAEDHRRDPPDRRQGAGRPGDGRPRRRRRLGPRRRAGPTPPSSRITGFCWGGRIVWLYAAHNKNLKAGVAWYGRVVGDTTEHARPSTRSTSRRASTRRCSASTAAPTPASRSTASTR